jgi:hypothetical protein
MRGRWGGLLTAAAHSVAPDMHAANRPVATKRSLLKSSQAF